MQPDSSDWSRLVGVASLVVSVGLVVSPLSVDAGESGDSGERPEPAAGDDQRAESSETRSGDEAGEEAETSTSYELKVASLAPEGSTWAKAIERMDRRIRQRTDGQVRLQLYPGGVMGDEPAMVRKMRSGQLDGAAVTNTGLSKIAPEVLVLQLPLLFKNWEEVDHVREAMSERFESLLEENGFTLLSWGDVGFNYLFSKTRIQSPDDLKSVKFWVWESDPVMKKVVEVADVNAVPLTVTDVLPSLSTGVIDAFSNSPYGAVSLQWYTRADYVTNLKLGVVVGGLVIRNESIADLPEEHRRAVLEVTEDVEGEMLAQIREDNEKAIQTIQSTGVDVVQPKSMEAWRGLAEQVRSSLAGELFPASLLETIRGHLEDYRADD